MLLNSCQWHIPSILYCWTLKEQDKKRPESLELWCLRWLLRIPLTAKKKNADVVAGYRPEKRLLHTILQKKLSLIGHSIWDKSSLSNTLITGMAEAMQKPPRWCPWISTAKVISIHFCRLVADSATTFPQSKFEGKTR